ncbi:MAG: hypothetical protein ABI315_03630 [Bacteroidia bacterium]
MNKLFSGLALGLLVIIFSCRKENSKASWDMQVATPLVYTTLNINNLLPDSIVKTDADNSLKIVYENQLYNLSSDAIIKIPDTTLRNAYNLPIDLNLPPGQIIPFPSNSETTYKLKGIELRTAIIKSGYVKFVVKSKIKEKTKFTYSIPCAKLNGKMFSIDIEVPARVGNTPGVFSEVYSLANYVFDLTGVNKNKINTIYTNVKAAIDPNAKDTVSVSTTDSLSIENNFFDIKPLYAKGYFGNTTIEIPATKSNFQFIKKITAGTIKFDDVKFKVSIDNFIGFDTRILISKLNAISTQTNTVVPLTNNTIIGSSININRASDNAGTVTPSNYNYTLAKNNSNIVSMINSLPDKFEYAMKITTNPMGNLSGSNDFVYIDHLMYVKLQMEIPLSFYANNLTLSDTLDFYISTGDKPKIKSGMLTMIADNGYPFDATVQFYLLDDHNKITDSLLEKASKINTAALDNNFKVLNKTQSVLKIPINENKVILLYNTKKVILKASYNTAAAPNYVKIFSTYEMDIKLTGDFNYTVQLQ